MGHCRAGQIVMVLLNGTDCVVVRCGHRVGPDRSVSAPFDSRFRSRGAERPGHGPAPLQRPSPTVNCLVSVNNINVVCPDSHSDSRVLANAPWETGRRRYSGTVLNEKSSLFIHFHRLDEPLLSLPSKVLQIKLSLPTVTDERGSNSRLSLSLATRYVI